MNIFGLFVHYSAIHIKIPHLSPYFSYTALMGSAISILTAIYKVLHSTLNRRQLVVDWSSAPGVVLQFLEFTISVQDVFNHVVITPVLLHGNVVLSYECFSIHRKCKELCGIGLDQVLSTGQQDPIDLLLHQVIGLTSGRL